MTHHTAGKAAHNRGMIVIANLSTGTGLVDGFKIGRDLFNRPHKGQSRIDRMAGKIPKVAIGHALAAPGKWVVWAGQKVFFVHPTKPCNVPDRALFDEAARKLACGGSDIIKPNHIDHIRCLCSQDHGAGVLKACCKGLFA